MPCFGNEPLYCESSHSAGDVLYSGSDDEYYESPSARTQRLEEHARLFLDGRRPVLLSACLRGPFDKAGWDNPWKGRRRGSSRSSKTAQTAEIHDIEAMAPEAVIVRAVELGTTPASREPADDGLPVAKKRMANDWLRRKNIKRMRASPDGNDRLTVSPSIRRHKTNMTTTRTKPAAALKRSFSAPGSSSAPGSFSAPAEIQDSMLASSDEDELQISQYVADRLPSRRVQSHISNSDYAGTVPLDMQWQSPWALSEKPSQKLRENDSSQSGGDFQYQKKIQPAKTVSEHEHMPVNVETAPILEGSSNTVIHETFNATIETPATPKTAAYDYQDDAGDASDVGDASQQLLSEIARSSQPPQPNATGSGCLFERSTTNHTGAEDVLAIAGADIGLEDVSTSDHVHAPASPLNQNPSEQPQVKWASSPPLHPPSLAATLLAGTEAALPTTQENKTITEIPGVRDPSSMDMSCELPLPAAMGSMVTGPPSVDLLGADTPNPPADPAANTGSSFASSLSHLPTSPCSPDQKLDLPKLMQEAPVFVPATPPAPACAVSIADPSTPETKQSSLPTPDMSVSIKSFRRFWSRTPTPPPRQRTAKTTNLRSILAHPRKGSRLYSGERRPSPGRLVCFHIPHDEVEATGIPFLYTYGLNAADEEDNDSDSSMGKSKAEMTKLGVRPHGPRAASPPPQGAALTKALSSEVDKFQGHFASFAKRAQQGCSREDALGSTGTETSSVLLPQRASQQSAGPYPLLEIKTLDADKENAHWSQDADEGGDGGGEESTDAPVDDVQEVIDNLDDFLGMWNMEAELAEMCGK